MNVLNIIINHVSLKVIYIDSKLLFKYLMVFVIDFSMIKMYNRENLILIFKFYGTRYDK